MDGPNGDVVMNGTADHYTLSSLPAQPATNGTTPDLSKLSVNGVDLTAKLNGNGVDPLGNGDQDYDNEEDEDEFPEELQRLGLLPTGCCYDDRMKLHANADFGLGPHHPEDPARIEAIMMTFKKAGLVHTGSPSKLHEILQNSPTKYMWRIAAREATRQEIETIHLPEHYDWVAQLSKLTTDELRMLSKKTEQHKSFYVGSMTFEAALISAGGAIETCKSVVAGTVKNAFAIIRPPGHHAEYDTAGGFCLFNNVPIAAKICQKDYPEACRKILILDWDVHHGNGIQNLFYNDPNVLYISLHVYQNGTFYPGQPDNPEMPDGGIANVGTGEGLGKNINIGWHDQGMGDGEYLAAFQKIIMPIGQEFDPDLVIISAGFDAAAGDELGGCFVTPSCYAHMTHMLMALANGKVAVCLEGGYNLHAISASALAVAKTLMGEPPPRMELPMINKEAAYLLAKVQAYQAPYWRCMRAGIVNVPEIPAAGGVRLHDVVRNAQRQTLAQRFGMIPQFIQRETLFKSFESQVLVTPRLEKAKRILVIVHDPPEMVAQPDPVDNSLDAHNAWVSDGVTKYIEWAVSQSFGVMDINVPHYITHAEDSDPHIPRMDEAALTAQIADLMCYLWDNYLSLYEDADELFIMGVGFAYVGIKNLLIGRDCKSKINGIVNFVTGNLRPVRSDIDTDLPNWYKENSQIYVSGDHILWDNPDMARKATKKRFGSVLRSPETGLNGMMKRHAGDVQRWIMERVGDDDEEEEDGVRGGDTTEDERV